MKMNEGLTPLDIYELVAEAGFKKYFHLGGNEATRRLIDLCSINKNNRVIDIGCATGKTACRLARRYGCKVVGVDILPAMIERAKERASAEGVTGSVEFKVGDAQKLPFEDDLFDVVLGEFITGMVDDKESAVSEYIRVAKPGGTIGLNEATWLKAPPPQEIIGFLSRTVGFKGELFTSDGWKQLLERQGLKEIMVRTNKAESLSNPMENIKDLLRSFPQVLYGLIRRPKFRALIKMSLSIPKNLLDYFGYGLYVGRTGQLNGSEE
jgi:ubiquinone/menaquinone biosynthesis C-methylase UbiE